MVPIGCPEMWVTQYRCNSASVSVSARAETVLVCQCKSRDSASASVSGRAETVLA